MARYLVTGGTGFLGGHLVDHIVRGGHAVVALCRREDEDSEDLEARGAKVALGDVLDGPSVERAAKGCDGALHCAGKVSRDPDDAEELYRVHVEGTRTTLAACRASGVKRFVLASSSGTVAVGDDPKHVANEDDEPDVVLISRWPYYRSKLYAERAALAQNAPHATPSFEVLSVNPTLLLGPGDVRGSSTDDVRLFLERRIPAIPGGGLSFVDARDAAVAMALAMEKGQPGRRYLVGACNLTIRDFFARLERLSGVRAPVLPVPRLPSVARLGAPWMNRALRLVGGYPDLDPVSLEMAQYFWYLDSSRAEKELGWTPRDPTTTLADTIRDLQDRGVVTGAMRRVSEATADVRS
jgi:dihydroflavonol-4-reductase